MTFRSERIRRCLATWLTAVALASLTTWFVFSAGLPALRHDWLLPRQPDAFEYSIEALWGGWVPLGIGAPQDHPTFYLVGFVLWALHYVFRNWLILGSAVVFGTTLITARSAMHIAVGLGCGIITEISLALFATLNPWVYTEYVAGHIFMVLAYGMMIALVAQVMSREPSHPALLVLSAASITQLEFFLVFFPLFALWAALQKRWAIVITGLVASLPIIFGIVAEYPELRRTPYNLAWQTSQSIDPAAGVMMSGYYTLYDSAFRTIAPTIQLVALIALLGVPLAWKAPVPRAIVIIGAASFLFATGVKGPIAAIYRSLVLHFPESGVVRELYDLIAFLAVSYLILLAYSLSHRPWLAPIVGLVIAVMFIPWFMKPPATFFVSANSIPQAVHIEDPAKRVAFFPSFQPLSFRGKGSGADPDAYLRAGRAVPINELIPSYPVSSALSYGEQFGDFHYLGALGVSAVVSRPYLASRYDVLRDQWVRDRAFVARQKKSTILKAIPLVSIVPRSPALVSIGNDPSRDDIFFGDMQPNQIYVPEPSRETLDPRRAWVDARLAFPIHPEWGNAFGGVTTSTNLPLPLPSGSAVLAQTNGTLLGRDGTIIAKKDKRLRWWPLKTSPRSVVCRGTCVVVMSTDSPWAFRWNPPSTIARHEVNARMLAPWLYVARLSESNAGTLRYNVRYNSNWKALTGGHFLRHFRLETTVNGWYLPSATQARTVYIVQVVALIQFCLEIFAGLFVLSLIVPAMVRGPKRRPLPLLRRSSRR